MGTTLATQQDLQRLASKQDVVLLRQEVALLRHELLVGSLDTFHDDFTRKLAEFERKLTLRFGVMFFSGCGLTIALMWSWS